MAALGWEKLAGLGEAPLCDARQPPHPTEGKQDRPKSHLQDVQQWGQVEMLSMVSACPADQLCYPRGQVTPSSSGLGGVFHLST